MDNRAPQQGNPQPQNGQPLAQPSSGFGSGMKVIQPLTPDLRPEESPAPQAPTQPAPNPTAASQLTPAQATNATSAPQKPSTSSIYPDATKGVGANNFSIPNPADNAKGTAEATTFDKGYSIGSTIFWYQLIAAIVFGLIFYGLTTSVLKTSSASLAAIVGLLHYVFEYLVLLYLPYSVLKSNEVEEPFWLTLFGMASQTVIVVAVFELVNLIIVKAIISNGVTSSITHVGGSGLAATAIIVYVGFLIASYFLTKLSWGVAFSLFGKITNKVVVKAVGVGVIAIILGGIAYHYLTLPSSKVGTNPSNALTTSQSNSLSNYNVGGNPSYSVNFYEGSIVTTLQGQTILLRSDKNGGQVYLLVNTATNPTTSCTFAPESTFTFTVEGNQGLGCYQTNGSDGYVKVNNKNYVIKLISDNNDQAQQTTKSIFSSIIFN